MAIGIVIFQLLKDVHRSIPIAVSHGRVKGTGGVQSIGIRVKLQFGRHFSSERIYTTRGASLAVSTIDNHIETHLLAELVVGIEICCIAIAVAILHPTWVGEHTDGGIVRRLIASCGEAHCMVLHHSCLEELGKPVGIAILGSSQVSRLGRFSVVKAEVSIGASGIEQFVHTSDFPFVATVGKSLIGEVATA